jgi:phosphatidylglycerophosphate synthase
MGSEVKTETEREQEMRVLERRPRLAALAFLGICALVLGAHFAEATPLVLVLVCAALLTLCYGVFATWQYWNAFKSYWKARGLSPGDITKKWHAMHPAGD